MKLWTTSFCLLGPSFLLNLWLERGQFGFKQIMETFEVKKKLTSWINNVFGVNQYSVKKNNVYKQSCYPERSKIHTLDRVADAAEIRIEACKIILIGQHPQRLFNEKHESKFNSKKIIEMDDFTLAFGMISKNKSKYRFTPLVKTNKLVRSIRIQGNLVECVSTGKIVEMYFLSSDKMAENKKIRSFQLPQFEQTSYVKNTSNSNFNDVYAKKKDKFLYISLKADIVVVCRSLKFELAIVEGNRTQTIKTKDFVSCLIKNESDSKIYCGMTTGTIQIYSVTYGKGIEIQEEDEFMAHECEVTVMLVNEKKRIIVSGDEKGHLLIRNSYSFELMNYIYVGDVLSLVDIQMSSVGFLYVVALKESGFHLTVFTVNGLVIDSDDIDTNCFGFDKIGNLLLLEEKRQRIRLCNPVNIRESKVIDIDAFGSGQSFCGFGFTDGKLMLFDCQGLVHRLNEDLSDKSIL